MLPQAAAERPAGHSGAALALVTDAPQVAPRRVGKEDVGPQVNGLRCPLEAPSEAGERVEVDGGIDGDEHIGILRHRLVGRQGADEGDPEDTRR